MKLIQKVKSCAIVLGWLMLAQSFFINASIADDVEMPGKKLAGQCKICHGSTGIAQIPIAPNLAGESTQYLVDQLNAYKSGKREHEMMTVVAKTLDDNSIESLAKWYASQPISASMIDDSADQSAIAGCIECHGSDGIATKENTPHLAGESVIYIDTQLKAFRTGKRTHELMSPIAMQLTDEQMRSAAEWYSAIRFDVLSE